MTRTLRFRLAARMASAVLGALALMSAAGLLGVRTFLDRELYASLLNIASIQASSVTDAPGGEMRFHEWDLSPDEASRVRELNRWAQVWSADGTSLLRTQTIVRDLPLDSAALATAARGELTTTDQTFEAIPIRSLWYPLERLGALHAHHVLQVAAPLTGRNRLLSQLALLLGGITLLAGGVSFLGGWWLALRVVRPVHEIIGQAESIRAGNLGRRIEASADSQEYERLIAVLNTMLARLESGFETQRRFTADASHELRSPLTALRGEIEVALRRERAPAEYRRVLDSNLQEVARLSRLAEDLLTLARTDAGVVQPRLEDIDLGDRIGAAIARLRPAADHKHVSIDARVDIGLVQLDPTLVDQLFWNLLENALKFSPEGGRIRVSAVGDGGEVVIDVTDEGPGIAPTDRDRIFERFFRADAARTVDEAAGTGLGLAIVQAIAAVHGGTIEVLEVDRGAWLRARLPARLARET